MPKEVKIIDMTGKEQRVITDARQLPSQKPGKKKGKDSDYSSSGSSSESEEEIDKGRFLFSRPFWTVKFKFGALFSNFETLQI